MLEAIEIEFKPGTSIQGMKEIVAKQGLAANLALATSRASSCVIQVPRAEVRKRAKQLRALRGEGVLKVYCNTWATRFWHFIQKGI